MQHQPSTLVFLKHPSRLIDMTAAHRIVTIAGFPVRHVQYGGILAVADRVPAFRQAVLGRELRILVGRPV